MGAQQSIGHRLHEATGTLCHAPGWACLAQQGIRLYALKTNTCVQAAAYLAGPPAA